MRKAVFASLLSLSLLSACVQNPQNDDPSAFQLQLLHFADVDGGRDIIGNAPRFSALVNYFRDGMKDNTLVVSSGDNWIPGPEYNVAADPSLDAVLGKAGEGRAHVAFLNALGVQASAVGNHELDMGPAAFAGLIAPKDAWAGAKFPYLSTNLNFESDSATKPLVTKDGQDSSAIAGKLTGYTVVTVGKEKIGVIGASTPTLKSITSVDKIGVFPENPDDLNALAALIQADADALTAQGINKIVLLAHMQKIAVEQALAPKLKHVDVIVAGGSNTILADSNDRLRPKDAAKGNYPQSYKGADGNPVLLVNTEGDYQYLGRLVMDFDAKGVILTNKLDDKVNGIYASDEEGLKALNISTAKASSQMVQVADGLKSALRQRAGNVLGYTNVYLNGERLGVRLEETNLGNLSADANLAYAKTIDANTSLSLKNGGGIRAPIGACIIPPGTTTATPECRPPAAVEGISPDKAITQLDLQIAFRFNNSLSLVTVTGEQLLKLLEHSVSSVEGTGGAFPQVAGLTFTFDPKAAKGKRISQLVAKAGNGSDVTIMKDGVTQADGMTTKFRMVTLGFLAAGGDAYPFPKQDTDATGYAALQLLDLKKEGSKTGKATFADDGTEQDVLAEYLAQNYATPATAYNEADKPKNQDQRIRQ